MEQQYGRSLRSAKHCANSIDPSEETHDPLRDPRPHDQKLRIPIVLVALKRLSQAARVNVHRDIHAYIVQSLTGLKHSALSQLRAHLERVTLYHSSDRERFLQTALRDPTVGLQHLKPFTG